jgi:hypothetical protein
MCAKKMDYIIERCALTQIGPGEVKADLADFDLN